MPYGKPHDRIEVTVLSSSTTHSLVPVDPAAFRRACARFATGITVSTVSGEDGTPYGITANSFTSVSCAPPLVLICIDHRATGLHHFRGSSAFAINVLDESQRDHSVRFSQRKSDRFEGIAWRMSDAGLPLLDGVIAQLECWVRQTLDAGDHTIFIGEVFRVWHRDGPPLLYYASEYRGLRD